MGCTLHTGIIYCTPRAIYLSISCRYFCVYEFLKGWIKPPVRLYLFPYLAYGSLSENNFSSIVTSQPIRYHQAPSSGASHKREHTSIEYKRKMRLPFCSDSRLCLSPLLSKGPPWRALPYYEISRPSRLEPLFPVN